MKWFGKLSFNRRFVWFLFGLAIWQGEALSAPCCGGGQGQTSMIVGDQRAMATFHYLFSTVVLDALNDGTYLERDDTLEELQHSYIFDGVYQLTDRWQVGARVPLMYRYVSYESQPRNYGLGDALVQGTWEAVPEIRYSAYRPRLFLFSQIMIPLGNSSWESTRPATSFSRGFWSMAAGLTALKQWSFWDASLSSELHHGLPKDVNLSDTGRVSANPGVGSSVTGSLGYRFDIGLRLGITESFVYESGVSLGSGRLSSSSSQYFWSTSLQAGYTINDQWTVMANYTDQTLLGAARNVALSRIFGFSVQKSWDR